MSASAHCKRLVRGVDKNVRQLTLLIVNVKVSNVWHGSDKIKKFLAIFLIIPVALNEVKIGHGLDGFGFTESLHNLQASTASKIVALLEIFELGEAS